MLKAIIVDDEPYCCEILAAMLQSDCPDVNVVNISNSGHHALAASVRFTRDGQTIYGVGLDGEIRFWEAPPLTDFK